MLLANSKMAFVASYSGLRFPYSRVISSDTIYLRLHGNQKSHATDYRTDELLYFAEKPDSGSLKINQYGFSLIIILRGML